MATPLVEHAYFKFVIRSSSAATSTQIVKVELRQLISEVLANIIEDNVTVTEDRCGEFLTPADTPLSVREFGNNTITVWVRRIAEESEKVDQNNNIFDVLMTARRKYDSFPKPREEHNEKDRLHSDVIKLLQANHFGFTSQQVDTVGHLVVSTITHTLWYLDPFLERMATRCVKVPDIFKGLTGYRQLKKQKKKIPQLLATELKDQTGKLGELLLYPWMMNKDMAVLRGAVENLHSGMTKYYSFLTAMQKRTADNQNKSEPVRSFHDSWSLKVLDSTSIVRNEYQALDQALKEMSNYKTLDLCNFEPTHKEDRRKWLEGLQVSCTLTHFTYQYGNYLGNVNIVWKVPPKQAERNPSEDARLVNVARDGIMVFATRKMRKNFIEIQ